MNYEVWGAASVRHKDNYTLAHSEILLKMENDQQLNPKKFQLLGDSAYSECDYLKVVGDGRGWSSIREAVELDYKDLKQQWKYMDYRHALKIMGQPVSKIVFICKKMHISHLFY
jgi:hypothetical protein